MWQSGEASELYQTQGKRRILVFRHGMKYSLQKLEQDRVFG